MARALIHHRTADFRQLFVEALDGLKYVLQTASDVVLLASSGTGAMEAAVVNVVPQGGKALVLESGKFSERWRKIAETFGIEVVRYEVPWGEPFQADEVARLLDAHTGIAAVFTTLLETSTGVAHDIQAIGRVVAPRDALLVVDGISGVGAERCLTDAWGIDVLAVGGQKALMVPPGLALLSVSPAAWKQIASIPRRAFYFDLLAYRKALASEDVPYTPATPLIVALAENLRAMRAEGMEAIWTRTERLARAARAGVAALGLTTLAQRPAAGMTAAYLPEGVDGKAFLKRLETRFGLTLAGGQGHLQGKIFRIAHMGAIDELDLLAALSAVELVLVEFGQSIKLGAGVGAASEILARLE